MRESMENDQTLLATLARQEEELQFTAFTNETALELGLRLVDTAKRQGKAVAVDICRNDLQLFHYAMSGMSGHNADLIRRKRNVVKRYGRSSYCVATHYRIRGMAFDERTKLDPRDCAAEGGGFPLIIKSVGVVGALTVSGMPDVEDHVLIVSELKSFLAQS